MARCSGKTNELRDIDSIGCRAGNITIQNGKLTISKSKSSRLLSIWVETISLEIDKCKSKNAASVSEVLALLSWSSEGYTFVFDLPCCQNKHY